MESTTTKIACITIVIVFLGAAYLVMTGSAQSIATAPAPPEVPAADLTSPSPTVSTAPKASSFIKQFEGCLVSVNDGVFKPYHPPSLQSVQYLAFYYSASWCPPCHKFTPHLIYLYNQFKPSHPNFEMILVSHDKSEGEMLSYMRDNSMTCPAIDFNYINQANGNRYYGRELPDLVLVDSTGKILSDSFNGSTYLGPQKVLFDIFNMVPTP